MGTPKGDQQSPGRKSLIDEVVAILGRGFEILEASARPTGGVEWGRWMRDSERSHKRSTTGNGQGILVSTGGSGADLSAIEVELSRGQRMTLASGSSTAHSVERDQPGAPCRPHREDRVCRD